MGDGAVRPAMGMPDHLGRYEMLLPLSSDGRRDLYLAHVPGAEAPYAVVELIARSRPGFEESTLDQLKLVIGLRHRNVLQVLDAEPCEQGMFLAMEYVPGDPLDVLFRDAGAVGSPLPRAIALRILTDALLGLDVVHEHIEMTGCAPSLVVHRDFSPRNIMVGTDGIARVTGFDARTAATGFAAPEVVAGTSIDRRCDVWAAGVIAWEVLTGRSFASEGSPAPGADPPRVRTFAALSNELDELVASALAVHPERRVPNARQLGRELADAATASGLLAELDEVASHVQRSVRAQLSDRKQRFAEARRQLSQRPRPAPDVRTMIGMGAPAAPTLTRAPLPELPTIPVAHDDGASELRIAVAPSRQRPAERANASILGPPSLAPEPQEEAIPGIVPSPLAPTVEPRGSLLPSGGQDAVTFVRSWLSPPWTTKKISTLAAAGGIVLGFLLVLAVIATRGKAKVPTTAGSSSSPGATSIALPGTTAAGTVETSTAAPASASASATAPDPALLLVKANGPIASAQVGGRMVDAIVPAPTLSIELTEEERTHAFDVVVNSTDGRVATLKRTAGQLDLDVTFGDKPRPSRTAPAGHATVKHPWTKQRPR